MADLKKRFVVSLSTVVLATDADEAKRIVGKQLEDADLLAVIHDAWEE